MRVLQTWIDYGRAGVIVEIEAGDPWPPPPRALVLFSFDGQERSRARLVGHQSDATPTPGTVAMLDLEASPIAMSFVTAGDRVELRDDGP